TDVEMLRAPWEEMEPGKLYVGSEPKTYADTWAKQNHPERIYQEFIEEHRNDVMLNAGLLGGTRKPSTLMLPVMFPGRRCCLSLTRRLILIQGCFIK
ncbi:hypothetical protein AAHD99_23285, partial [Enterobacter hormaechei]